MTNLNETQPSHPKEMDDFQPVPIERLGPGNSNFKRKHWRRLIWIFILAPVLVYFFAPLRTNILFLGTDNNPVREARGDLGRTDTIILTTIVPLKPYIGMLGIPRDLWLDLPDVGEQRINTAYFYAEVNQPGSGADATAEAVRQNFGVSVDYRLLLRMLELVDVVDALGGVDITLDTPMGGLPAGTHHLDGIQTLAFVRNRQSGDDFSRMQQGQILILAAVKKMLQPSNWSLLPEVWKAANEAIDSDIPTWQWPRLGVALLRGMLSEIDTRTIDRQMVTPFTTDQGAQVLLPEWEQINPVLKEMFGE